MTIALIPARSGSERVPNKNIRTLMGHPLIAYSIAQAKESGIFAKVIVSTDSSVIADISLHYGCDKVILRPESISGTLSPDIEWILHALDSGLVDSDFFGILRVTSPIRKSRDLSESLSILISEEGDSIRAIKPVNEHPGKMWILEGKGRAGQINPLLKQPPRQKIAYHARQYQDLPKYYVQTSSFEFIRTESVVANRTREGKKPMGYVIDYPQTLTVDYEADFEYLKYLCSIKKIDLPSINCEPIPNRGTL